MIIHCLGCGKCISSKTQHCPYCLAELTELTLEMNGIQEKTRIKERMLEMVFGLVHK